MVKLKKIKIKKIVVVLLLCIVVLYSILKSKNYEKEYIVDGVNVLESYQKKEKEYNFTFLIDGQEFFVPIESKYVLKRKLIQKIEVRKKEDTLCIVPKSKTFSFSPLCKQKDEYISYHLIKDEELLSSMDYKKVSTDEKTFQNLKLYNLNHRKYYIWNYKGFLVVDEKNQREISLFSDDVYNIPLTIQVGDSLLIADYDSRFAFNKFYVIFSKNNKVREIPLEKEISFESYFVGTINKKAYLVDKKNKKEYEIYPKKLSIDNVTNNNRGKIFVDELWESVSMNSLVTNETSFNVRKSISYAIYNNCLYALTSKNKIKLSDQNVKEIVFSDSSIVYYLVDDKLYYYTVYDGEVLVMSNFEWNFNYKNMIYIF